MAFASKRSIACLTILGGCFGLSLFLLRGGAPRISIPPAPILGSQLSRARVQPIVEEHSLGKDRTATARLVHGTAHLYSFRLRAGEILHAMVDQDVVPRDSFDLALDLYGPDTRKLFEIDSQKGDKGPEEIFFLAEKAGIYHVAVTESWHGGTYRIRLLSIRRASREDQANAEAEKIFHQSRLLVDEKKEISGFLKAAEIWQRLGKTGYQAEALRRVGDVLKNESQYEDAAVFQAQALELYRRLQDGEREANQLNALGVSSQMTAKLDKAEQLFRQSREVAQKASAHQVEAEALLNLCTLIRDLGKSWLALDACEASLEAARGLPESQLKTLPVLGSMYVALGKFGLALAAYEKGLKLETSLESPAIRGQILSRLSEMYMTRKQPRDALPYAQRALVARRQAGAPRDIAVGLSGLSLVLQQLGDPSQARGLQEQALSLFHQSGDAQSEGIAHLDLGFLLLSQRDLPKAILHLEQALKIARKHGPPEVEVSALYQLALAERERGAPLASRRQVEAALERLRSLSASQSKEGLSPSYAAARQGSYDLLIDLLVGSPAHDTLLADILLSLEASERARWQSLAASLVPERLLAGILKRADPRSVAERRRLDAEIGKLEEQRVFLKWEERATDAVTRDEEKLAEQRDILDTRLQRADTWAATVSRPAPITFKEIQQLLDPGTSLLEYRLGETRSLLWLVTTQGVEVFDLPPRNEIENSAHRLYDLLAESQWHGNQRKTKPLIKELSAMLLGPVADRLRGRDLVVAPDGAIQLVPFAILLDPRSRASQEASQPAPPLYREHRISYLPSASVLRGIRRELSHRPVPTGRLAVLADAVFREPGLVPLPHSRQEAQEILALVPKGERKLAELGYEANRELVMSGKLADFSILHFATHATEHPERFALSSIVLSQIDTQNRSIEGRLGVNDIQSLSLPADLVVLSACKTALGKDVRGEGNMGLTQAFMYAGAARVLVSLWNVNDESTPQFMARFYKALLQEKKSPAEALGIAQRWMAEETRWSSPYYWAGFELHGEWR